MTDKTTSILFVCMGNICRSPAAEGIFIKLAENAGCADRFRIDSAGTLGYHAGSPADARMQAAAAKRGYRLDSISRKVTKQDIKDFDYIIAMDRQNLHELQQLAEGVESGGQIRMMCEFSKQHDDEEVPDPYYGGKTGFDHVINLLEDSCTNLLERLTRE